MLRRMCLIMMLCGLHVLAMPDLSVTAVAFPAKAVFGETMVLSATVVNSGSTPTLAAARVGFYFDRSSRTSLPDLLLGSCMTPVLLSGATYSCTVIVNTPAIDYGSYQGYALVDDTNQIAELDESNNKLLATQYTLVGGANLMLKSLTFPPSVSPGQKIVMVATVQTPDPVSKPFRLGIYLAADSSSPPSIFLGACTFLNLYREDTCTLEEFGSIPFQTNLTSLKPGVYFPRAMADDLNQVSETSEIDNYWPAAIPVRLGGVRWIGGPSMTVEAVSALRPVSLQSPCGDGSGDSRTGIPECYGAPIYPGDTISVTVQGSNEGNINPSPAYRTGFYLVDASGGKRFLGSCQMLQDKPSAVTTCSASITIPADVSPQVFSLYASLDDLHQLQDIIKPADLSSPTIPGTVMRHLISISPRTHMLTRNLAVNALYVGYNGESNPTAYLYIIPGKAYDLHAWVRTNSYVNNAPISYYLSTTPGLTGVITKLGTCIQPTLDPFSTIGVSIDQRATNVGLTEVCGITGTTPSTLPSSPQRLYFVVVVDEGNTIAETTKTDNVGAVGLDPPPTTKQMPKI